MGGYKSIMQIEYTLVHVNLEYDTSGNYCCKKVLNSNYFNF